jgi:hypothetical protein
MADDDNTGAPPTAKGDRFYREPVQWVVWSEEHGQWWQPPGVWGYTPSLLKAGRFSETRAREIADDGNRYSEEVREVALPDPLGVGGLDLVAAAALAHHLIVVGHALARVEKTLSRIEGTKVDLAEIKATVRAIAGAADPAFPIRRP